MSAPDLHDLELNWPSLGPTDVIVTGTFDQWSSSVHLVRGDGGFFGTVKVPWGQKIAYKYIVDGRWQCRDDRPQEDDGHGNINNVLLTPERPILPALFILTDSEKSDGLGDIEAMVTAVEFLTPVEPVAVKGSLPLPIPQITVDFSKTPMVTEAKLDTAVATEGHNSPASVTPTGFSEGPLSDAPPVYDVGSVRLPDGNGEAHSSEGFSTHVPIQIVEIEAPTSSVDEVVQEVVVVSSEPAVSSPQASEDVSALADRVDVPATAEPSVKQPEADLPETATTAPPSIDQASTSSPSSNTAVHKKRRSLLEKIKHIFDKNKEKKERKKL